MIICSCLNLNIFVKSKVNKYKMKSEQSLKKTSHLQKQTVLNKNLKYIMMSLENIIRASYQGICVHYFIF